MKKSLVLGLCLCAAQPALAQSLVGSSPGFHYFYRDGATIETHDKAVIDCLMSTRALAQPPQADPAMNGGLFGALIMGVIGNNEERQGWAANVENCMAVKGWSVRGLSEETGKQIEALKEPALISAAIAERMVLDNGDTLLRGPFANELFSGPFSVGPPTDLKEVSLSIRSVRDRSDIAIEAAGELEPPKKPKGYKTPKEIKSIDDKVLSAADPEKSHIVFRVSGDPTLVTYTGVLFQRLDAYGGEAVFDGEPTLYSTINGRSYSKKTNGVRTSEYIAEAPPGLWKIAAIQSFGVFDADLCFGAPAFVVEKGQTVFVGRMTLNHEEGHPLDNSDLEEGIAALKLAPQLIEKLVPAEFVNGYQSDCFGAYGYAYEIEGAPFVGQSSEVMLVTAGDDAVEAGTDATVTDWDEQAIVSERAPESVESEIAMEPVGD